MALHELLRLGVDTDRSTASEVQEKDTQENSHPTSDLLPSRVFTWRRWYWALVPLLAIAAYITVLRIGFLSDDFVWLNEAQLPDSKLNAFFPDPSPTWLFYRPVSNLLTWRLNWALWGNNPLPYHLMGLVIHAANSLVLALWVGRITASRGLGWLSGALFAVFPLHLEAVGWLSAQWDAWAALFGLLSLYCFTLWWERLQAQEKGPIFYAASLLFYVLGLLSKESLLGFIAILAAVAWYIAGKQRRVRWQRPLVVALIPFGTVLAAYLALRYFAWGNLGGYQNPEATASFVDRFWDSAIAHVHFLLAPVNPSVLGNAAAQIAGAITSIALLTGLALYGRKHRYLLAVAGAWIAVSLVPILNWPFANPTNLDNNRTMYLPAMGYCIVLGTLLYWALTRGIYRVPTAKGVGVGALVLACVALCWIQLRPWHTASVQADDIQQQLLRLVPPQPHANNPVWYSENMPPNYLGAPVFTIGAGAARMVIAGDMLPYDTRVEKAAAIRLDKEDRDAFAFRFHYSISADRHVADYAAGITDTAPPPTAGSGSDPLVWDFTGCKADVLSPWQVINAQQACEQGKGLLLDGRSSDIQLLGPRINLTARPTEASFLRLRAAITYTGAVPDGAVNQWYWQGQDGMMSDERSMRMLLRQTGKAYIYWTFIPTFNIEDVITRVRFDPINAGVPASVQWLAVDLVR